MRAAIIASICAASMIPAASASAAPANDDFADATQITRLPFTDEIDTADATAEEGERGLPKLCFRGASRTIWYRLLAPAPGTVIVDTRRSDNRIGAVAVYVGPSLDAMERLACMTSSGSTARPSSTARVLGGGGRLAFDVRTGQTYHLIVRGCEQPCGPRGRTVRLSVSYGVRVAGTVTDCGGNSLEGITVSFVRPDGSPNGGTDTRIDGTFSAAILPGDYLVRFTRGAPDVADQVYWYRDALGFNTADPISMEAGSIVEDLDAALPIGPACTSSNGPPMLWLLAGLPGVIALAWLIGGRRRTVTIV